MRFTHRVLATAAVVVGLGALVAGSPASAAARSGECSSYTRWDGLWNGRYTAWYPTTRYGSYSTNCNLLRGDTGPGVRLLQQVLNRCYGAGLTTDGIYGSATAGAVYRVWRNETGVSSMVYEDYLRRHMDWVNWRYDDRGAHSVCLDNSLAG